MKPRTHSAAVRKSLRQIDALIAAETAERAEYRKAHVLHMVLACTMALRDLRIRRRLMSARA
jgi:hypothetical protein